MLYLVALEQRKNRSDLNGRVAGWKRILNTLHIHYGDRIEAATNP